MTGIETKKKWTCVTTSTWHLHTETVGGASSAVTQEYQGYLPILLPSVQCSWRINPTNCKGVQLQCWEHDRRALPTSFHERLEGRYIWKWWVTKFNDQYTFLGLVLEVTSYKTDIPWCLGNWKELDKLSHCQNCLMWCCINSSDSTSTFNYVTSNIHLWKHLKSDLDLWMLLSHERHHIFVSTHISYHILVQTSSSKIIDFSSPPWCDAFLIQLLPVCTIFMIYLLMDGMLWWGSEISEIYERFIISSNIIFLTFENIFDIIKTFSFTLYWLLFRLRYICLSYLTLQTVELKFEYHVGKMLNHACFMQPQRLLYPVSFQIGSVQYQKQI